jgi:DNA-binding MarR family transcriptional regulator
MSLSDSGWDEHQVLRAMKSGIAYDLPQVSSASGTILSYTSSALEKLRDQGYVETSTDPEGRVRYKKVVVDDDAGDDD